MKIFDTRFKTEGTSALKHDKTSSDICSKVATRQVIKFPYIISKKPQHAAVYKEQSSGALKSIIKKVSRLPLIQNLQYGTAQGKAFNRMKSWQSITVGCCFFAVALAFIFIGR